MPKEREESGCMYFIIGVVFVVLAYYNCVDYNRIKDLQRRVGQLEVEVQQLKQGP